MHPDIIDMAVQARMAQLRQDADEARLAAAARAARPPRRRRLRLPAQRTQPVSPRERQTEPAWARSCER